MARPGESGRATIYATPESLLEGIRPHLSAITGLTLRELADRVRVR